MSAGHLQCEVDGDWWSRIKTGWWIHVQSNVIRYNLWVVIQEEGEGVCRIGIGCRHPWLCWHCCKLTEGSAWHVEHSQEVTHLQNEGSTEIAFLLDSLPAQSQRYPPGAGLWHSKPRGTGCIHPKHKPLGWCSILLACWHLQMLAPVLSWGGSSQSLYG